ncbi:MAG TPA: MFS transporter [Candidatus Baltobacteraceae bacterium]|jgi:EmrB/QacA subfamily drug resistance transporter|nr:MFS transporter [Candidatus Baltobacteraceae bacterium]
MSTFIRPPCDDTASPDIAQPQHDTRSGIWVLAATILGSAMPGIDGTAVNVALPVLQRELQASSDAAQWVVEGYSLFLSALILVGGSLGDHFGRRRMFILGTIIFAAASAACAFASSAPILIGARCIQGIGGALLVPESLAIITASFDERHRGAAIGTWSGFLAITMAIGPLLGGWFVQALSWRYVFVINLPLAAIVIALSMRFIQESRDDAVAKQHIDWTGAAIATVALGLLTYGFIALQGGASPIAVGAIALGAVLFVAFVYVERHSRGPMIPLGIFRSGDFTVSNIYTLLLYAALGGALFFVPFNLINVQHYTPTAAGAALLPMILIMFIASRWSGGLVARVGARGPLTIGALIAAVGFVLFAFTGIGRSYWTSFFPAVLVLGIGASIFVAPLTTTVMNSAPPEHAGSASGINNAVSRVAGLLAIALLGIVIVFAAHAALPRYDSALPAAIRHVLAADSLLSGRAPDRGIPADQRPAAERAAALAHDAGFRDAMLISAALAAFSAVIAFTMLSGRSSRAQAGRRKEGQGPPSLNQGARPAQ